jgi:hypothetical protein
MPITDLLTSAVQWRPVIVTRNDRARTMAAFPQVSSRDIVPVEVESAPLPVPSTAYYGVGRDEMHARPTMWRYQALAISEWLSVMGWPFAIAKVPSALVVSMPRGKQNPIRSRANIDNPAQTSLGSLSVLGAENNTSPGLAKITF